MALIWDGLTITTYHHVSERRIRQANYKSVAYFNSSGREIISMGNSTRDDNSKAIRFSSSPPYLNWLKESSASAVSNVIKNLQAKIQRATIGTLTFDGESHPNMMVPAGGFTQIDAVHRVIIGSTTYYVQEFEIIFLEAYN